MCLGHQSFLSDIHYNSFHFYIFIACFRLVAARNFQLPKWTLYLFRFFLKLTGIRSAANITGADETYPLTSHAQTHLPQRKSPHIHQRLCTVPLRPCPNIDSTRRYRVNNGDAKKKLKKRRLVKYRLRMATHSFTFFSSFSLKPLVIDFTAKWI